MRKNQGVRRNPNFNVKALMLDFDGTISPINVPASEAIVPQETLVALRKIRNYIPIAIITSKSLPFIVEKTPFANAWSALCGLETKIGDVIIKASCLKKSQREVMEALKTVKSLVGGDLTIEEKLDSDGAVVAFSVDWRYSRDPEKAEAKASSIATYCETLPLFTVRYDKQPFFDVFPCKVDKGEALLLLKEKLGLQDGVLYMGDSALDNPAFEQANLAIGVIHAETPACLICDYFVKFEDVAGFLNALCENSFTFTPDLLIK